MCPNMVSLGYFPGVLMVDDAAGEAESSSSSRDRVKVQWDMFLEAWLGDEVLVEFLAYTSHSACTAIGWCGNRLKYNSHLK